MRSPSAANVGPAFIISCPPKPADCIEMENKKEPPSFNEDNSGPISYKFPFYETMELFIETLTGTCFELRVSPFETVISVKAKIQRLEGISIAQQHLIWNNLELEDEYCLQDYNISEGCTLKLVLAMRGGPINTRRVPVEDPTRDMADYMETSRDDIWDKIPSNKQVTFLVYREGDQLNFFRVVDRGDGTLTPLSESLSGGSMFNLYADDEDESEESPSGQQILENSITMNKMKLLKTKMENMTLSKKPKKIAKVKPRPPMAPRPTSSSVTAARHRLFRVLPHNGPSLNHTLYLPPVDQHPAFSYHNVLSPNFASGISLAPSTSSSGFLLKDDETADLTPLLQSAIPSPGRILQEELKSPRQQKMLPSLASQDYRNARTICTDFVTGCAAGGSGVKCPDAEVSLSEDKRVADDSAKELALSIDADRAEEAKLLSEIGLQTLSSEHIKEESQPQENDIVEPNIIRPVFPNPLGCVPMESGKSSFAELLPKDKVIQPTRYPAAISHNSLITLAPQRPPKTFDVNSLTSPTSPQLLHSLQDSDGFPGFSLSKGSRFRGLKLDSPGKKTEVVSPTEMSEMANKATTETLDSAKNVGTFASLARSTSRDNMQSNCGTSRQWTSGIALPASIQNFHEEIFGGIASPDRVSNAFVSPLGFCATGRPTTLGRRIGTTGTPAHLFPPVMAPTQTKKKNAKHCFLCGKKTGLATSYECRCGNNFCATHRYAETHECTYDYKTVGRRYLQDTNPVVSAPKLPKI
ncbi:AN1-type zinc finger protein 4 isoform X1 [Amblyraja radiata]|uniref:AN1-type zinc finger protein 4 isoform X1 n=1 Tax=Amblyraja radiata TaxID=386614 RepID=UPI00140301CD|nr:AN1-type zinc finger protein 4 isoform X1 [Amblyraja radiata]